MPGVLSAEIVTYMQNGDYLHALSKCEKDSKLYENEELLVLCGYLSWKINDIERAAFYYESARKLNASNKDAIAGCLLCAVILDRKSGIDALYDLISKEDSETCLLARASYYRANNNILGELDVLKYGYLLYPGSEDILIAYIDAKQRNNPNDSSLSTLFDEAISVAKDKTIVLEKQIKYLYVNESYNECSRLSKKIIRNYPNDPVTETARKFLAKIKKNENNKADGQSSDAAQKRQTFNMHDKPQPVETMADSLPEAMNQLNQLIGLKTVKEEIRTLQKKLEYDRAREEAIGVDMSKTKDSYHFVFSGNPGTGKTTVARLIGSIFKHYGVLEKGQLVEVSRADLVSQWVGDTPQKTQDAINKALGGVLFIDEAYSLISGNNDDVGHEALDTLVKGMEDHRTDFIVILAGYRDEMNNLLKGNVGLASRIRKTIYFPDYTEDELYEIAKFEASKLGYQFTEDGKYAFIEEINKKKVDKQFGNARAVRNLIADIHAEKAKNFDPNKDGIEYLTTLTMRDFGVDHLLTPEEKVAASLKKMNALTGLAEVKNEVMSMIDIAKYQKEEMEIGNSKFANVQINLNMIFTGNPGTGKTTVARIYSEILGGMGLLKRGTFIEATRGDLVGRYVGETAIKTKKICEDAYGGVLFIDEAYSLASGGSNNDFGAEAIATLITEMENNRDKLVVILAGYTREMEMFLDSNSGIESRIGKTIQFPDYSETELIQIFNSLCVKNDILTDDEFQKEIEIKIQEIYQNRGPRFGNAREIRNLYEKIWKAMVRRVEREHLKDDDRRHFLACDIEG